MGAGATALSSVCLAMVGYVSGEGAVQPATLSCHVWALYCLVPVLGLLIALPIFRMYKLRDKDIFAMTKCNEGLITREEAEASMSQKY